MSASSQSSRKLLLEARAHGMRFHPSYSEARLWTVLRGKRLGPQFRRQVVIGEFIVDFLASKERLVVEVDGDTYHEGRASADRRRDEWLRSQGFTVLRIAASLVGSDLAASAALVVQALGRG
jgi:very-short-patch-repair endonuclease